MGIDVLNLDALTTIVHVLAKHESRRDERTFSREAERFAEHLATLSYANVMAYARAYRSPLPVLPTYTACQIKIGVMQRRGQERSIREASNQFRLLSNNLGDEMTAAEGKALAIVTASMIEIMSQLAFSLFR